MEMSGAYLRQTVEHLRNAGYAVVESEDSRERTGELVFDRTKFQCQKDENAFVLELIQYPDGKEAYYLEILRMGSIRSTSFPLDSWKFRPQLVEFKYYIEPRTGLGLSFTLDL